MPAGVRWNTGATFTAHDLTRVVSLYRNQFDTLSPLEITWQTQSVPQNAIDAVHGSSMHRYYIFYHSHIMFHPADRVMRQFRLRQLIPLDPLPADHSSGTIASRIRSHLPRWENRFATHGVAHLSEPCTTAVDGRLRFE